ncbi:hypothetical protein JW859_00180 [bacterium]|nr:hypothetical protein [bacterium]
MTPHVDFDDLLEFGADSAVKAFFKRVLRDDGIDLDNWRRQSASALAGLSGSIIGSLLSGPLGFMLGTLGWLVGQSASYPGDRSPAEIQRQHREVLKWKAIERSAQLIADHCPSHLSGRFRDAFYAIANSPGPDRQISADEGAQLVSSTLAGVDYDTARKFQRLYNAALDLIG